MAANVPPETNDRLGEVGEAVTSRASTAVKNAIASKVPGGSAVSSAANLARNFNAQNVARAGAAAADTAIAASIGAATGGLGTVAYKGAKVLLKNRTTRYIILGTVIVVFGLIFSTIVAVHNSGPFGMLGFYFSNKGLIDQLQTLNDIKLSTGLCFANGAGANANAQGQAVAETSHTDSAPLLEDCLAAKNAAQTINKHQDLPEGT